MGNKKSRIVPSFVSFKTQIINDIREYFDDKIQIFNIGNYPHVGSILISHDYSNNLIMIDTRMNIQMLYDYEIIQVMHDANNILCGFPNNNRQQQQELLNLTKNRSLVFVALVNKNIVSGYSVRDVSTIRDDILVQCYDYSESMDDLMHEIKTQLDLPIRC